MPIREKTPRITKHKRVLFLILILAHMLDLFFSEKFIIDNVENEANPLMLMIYLQYGVMGMLLTKTAALFLIGIFLANIKTWIFYVLNIIMVPILLTGYIMAYQI